jgi:hypothetical protein
MGLRLRVHGNGAACAGSSSTGVLCASDAEAGALDIEHLVCAEHTTAMSVPVTRTNSPHPSQSLGCWALPQCRTVDLAYVLHKFGVNFRYLTTTIGVDPSYKDQPFYKDTLDADARRVNARFEQADQHQLCIEERSLSSSDLSALMRPQDCLVMALVDRRYLYRPSSGVPTLIHSWYAQCLGGYIGHYVLIAGYDSMRDGYYIYDPAKTAEPHFVDARSLNLARRCHGTDEDLLLIPWQQLPPRTPAEVLRGETTSAAA